MDITIRRAVAEDVHDILDLINELAIYEKAPKEVTISTEELLNDGFGSDPLYRAFVALVDNQIVGIALTYVKYSTWKGKCIFLEDIVVRESFRKKGIGRLLFEEVIDYSKAFGAARLEWQVLNWNEPAINFYHKFDAVLDAEWVNGKLTKDQIIGYKREKINSDLK